MDKRVDCKLILFKIQKYFSNFPFEKNKLFW